MDRLCNEASSALGSAAVMDDSKWIGRFHAGDNAVLAQLYEDYFDTAYRAAGQRASGVDRDAVVHDVFVKLINRREVREGFTGGSFAAWLTTLARNRAIDRSRRTRRETLVEPDVAAALVEQPSHHFEVESEAKRLVEQFRASGTPDELVAVFEARFVRQLNQRDAAKLLQVSRTTLALRERRLRKRLKRFVSTTEAV